MSRPCRYCGVITSQHRETGPWSLELDYLYTGKKSVRNQKGGLRSGLKRVTYISADWWNRGQQCSVSPSSDPRPPGRTPPRLMTVVDIPRKAIGTERALIKGKKKVRKRLAQRSLWFRRRSHTVPSCSGLWWTKCRPDRSMSAFVSFRIFRTRYAFSLHGRGFSTRSKADLKDRLYLRPAKRRTITFDRHNDREADPPNWQRVFHDGRQSLCDGPDGPAWQGRCDRGRLAVRNEYCLERHCEAAEPGPGL